MPNYPTSLDSLSNPTSSTFTDDTGFFLDVVISTLNDIAEAVEAKLGTGSSIPTTVGHVLRVTGAGATVYGYPILSTVQASLAADVNLNNTANFFDGPSVSLPAGTYFVVWSVLVDDTAGVASIVAKLWDGTTVASQGQATVSAAQSLGQIAGSAVVTVGSTTTWKVSCRDGASTSGHIKSAPTLGATGNVASQITALRIA